MEIYDLCHSNPVVFSKYIDLWGDRMVFNLSTTELQQLESPLFKFYL